MKRFAADVLIVGFALFSMFFSAGNIIFPPYTGLISGQEWYLGFICYYLADIGLALLAIFAMLRSRSIDKVEGIMHRLGRMPAVIIMGAAVLCIGPLLAIPRTCATVFEIAFMPWLGAELKIPFTVCYFALCLAFAIKETHLIILLGKYLIPVCVICLLAMIGYGVINPMGSMKSVVFNEGLAWSAISAGYQTMDVLAALIFGLIVINALKLRGYTPSARSLHRWPRPA